VKPLRLDRAPITSFHPDELTFSEPVGYPGRWTIPAARRQLRHMMTFAFVERSNVLSSGPNEGVLPHHGAQLR
jgi:hypothetical protein